MTSTSTWCPSGILCVGKDTCFRPRHSWCNTETKDVDLLVLDVDLIWPVVFLEEAMSVLVVVRSLSTRALHGRREEGRGRRLTMGWEGTRSLLRDMWIYRPDVINIESHA
jgi:hypothetical protein